MSVADVFLSYASEDRERVAPLVSFLERRGWSVWWDRVLKPGETWPQVIERELNAARCVVVAWSKNSIGSPWVRLEADRARIRHNMVPVILDDASVPPEFAVYQTLDMRDGAQEQKLEQLGDGVAQQLRRRRLRLTGITSGSLAAVALIFAATTCVFGNRCGAWSVAPAVPNTSFAVIATDVQSGDVSVDKVLQAFIDDVRRSLRRTSIGKVSSRAETMAIPAGASPIDLGKRLAVHWLLSLSVAGSPDHLHVLVELVDTTTGYLTDDWTLDGSTDALNTLNAAVVRKVVSRFLGDGSTVSIASNEPSEAYNSYLLGRAALRDGSSPDHLTQAESIFQAVLERWPQYALAEAALCEVDLARFEATRATEQFAIGERHCNRALEIDPNSSESALALGKLYLLQGRYDRAHDSFTRAVAASDTLAEARMGLGSVAVAQGRNADAEREFHSAVDAEPGYWRTYNALGNFLFQAGRGQEALAEHRKAAALAQHDGVALNNIGAALYLSGQMEAAINAWKKALELAPQAPTYSNLGGAYYLLGDYAQAVAMYERSVALVARDYRTWTSLADARALAGRADAATEAYRTAAPLIEGELALNSDDTLAHAFLAQVKSALGDNAAATNELALALAVPSNDWQLYLLAAVAEFRLDMPDAARSHIDQALRAGCPKSLIDLDPALHGRPSSS